MGGQFISTGSTFSAVIDYVASYDQYLAALIATTQYAYNPISNYSITESGTVDRNTSEDESTEVNSSVHLYPYDSNELSEGVLDNKGNSATVGNRDEVEKTTHKTTHEGLTGTTYQSLIEAERAIVVDVTRYMMEIFSHVIMWSDSDLVLPMEV